MLQVIEERRDPHGYTHKVVVGVAHDADDAHKIVEGRVSYDEVLTRTDDRDGDDSWATTWSVENRPDEDVVHWFLAEASLTPLSKWQVANAERICQLANMFGHLPINRDGQTPNNLLNLSIPCAQLIKTGIVTGVTDTFDGVNDQSVQDVERYCRMAVTRAEDMHGEGWYTNEAKRLNLP